MFPLPLTAWIGIAGLVAVLGIGGYATIQSSRLDACKAQSVVIQGKFDGFVAQAKAQGDAQNARAKELDEHIKVALLPARGAVCMMHIHAFD